MTRIVSPLEDLDMPSLYKVKSKMEEESIALLDVRLSEEFEADHILGAMSVPMEEL